LYPFVNIIIDSPLTYSSDLLSLGRDRQYSPLFVTWNKRSFAYTQEDARSPENAITQEDASEHDANEHEDEHDDEEDKDEEEDEEDVSLRGCIGTFTALPLEKGLREYAITR
jgi:AMMECR1 domain-containing protein